MVTKKNVRKSLVEQLINKNADIEVFCDLIDDYMSMWDIKKKLIADIKVRGITYNEPNVRGTLITKNNPSTKELVAVNKQMLSLLKELGLSTDKILSGEPDGDESFL